MTIMQFIQQLWQQAGTRFNILFAFSIGAVQATLISHIRGVWEGSNSSLLLCYLLVAAICIETVAIRWKLQELRLQYPGHEASGSVFFLWFVHLVIGPILLLLAGTAAGLSIETSVLLQIAMFILVIRDIIILLGVLTLDPLPAQASGTRIMVKGAIANYLLLVFAIFAYFVIWDGSVAVNGFAGRSFVSTLGELIAAFVLFVFFFFGTRMMHFVEEAYAIAAGKKEYGLVLTIFIAAAAAIIPLYFY